MEIKGLNTAPIKQGERLFVMTLKVKDSNNNDRILFMQISTLVDFLILLRNRMSQVMQRLQERGEDYKAILMASAESLTKNIPEIVQEEVMQPDPGNLIMSMAPKLDDERFTLITVLNNQHIVTLEIDDSQVEFIIMAIIKAIEVSNDKEAQQTIGAVLDFLMLYNVDLENHENLRYREVKHEPWKESLFSNYMAVLYCYDTEEGKKVLAGAVIKTNTPANTPETENIIQRVAMLTQTIKEIHEKYKTYQVFSRIIPSEPLKTLSKDHCLKALHSFCLEMQGHLTK
ncbi:YjeJ family protein [Enterobacteriaceae bacterium H4N4]|uniref:YjeJ family protein n=1 Tax=Silvania confinis TaxID=2926470 RepID=A0A9J6QIV9_9ENTR|nr:YjeJ family protein [Silvania confinis]MCU6669294.1 YjeJ family protein [Silvania confinis]